MQYAIAVFLISLLSFQCIYVQGQDKDIVDTAVAAGNFQTLVAALTAAGLVDTLKGTGPFTVFAPNDVAFGKLPEGTVTNLLKPENKAKLVNLLKYHVTSGKIMSTDLKPPQSVEMLAGGKIEVTKVGDNIKINEATVVAANVVASNGVIHVIDTVLTPKTSSAISLQFSQGFLMMLVSALFFLRRSLF